MKIFIRNLVKHPGYSVSNISSLAIGMTTCTLILLFVQYELNWNTYNRNYDHIYRVQQKVLFKDDVSIYGQTGYLLASELKKQIPEIEHAAVTGYVRGEYLSSTDERTFNEKIGCYADGNLFKVLTFEFLQGNPENALSEPFSIVMTKKLAEKYFPGENALGKMIKASKNKSLKVTGIIKNLPFNLDFRPDYIVSMPTYREVAEWKEYDKPENIAAAMFFTVVALKPNVSLQAVNDKIYNFQDRYIFNNFKKLYLKPFSELHLTSDERNDNKIAVYYIGAFAIFVLLLACINFINLSTANSFLRKKEIGIRKVVGASRGSLFTQFIGESLLFSFIAMIAAFILAEMLLPYFNTMIERHIEINLTRDFPFFLTMVSLFLLTGFLSGVYPALYLSGFRPVQVIKGNVSLFGSISKGSSKSFLRKSLVTVQFCISVLLLTGTVYVVNQVHYMNTKYLGFDKQDLMICTVYGETRKGRFEALRHQLLNNPNIINASISTNAPFHGSWGKEINWEGADITDKINTRYNKIDYDFIDTYKMSVVLGRNFSRQFSTDQQACLINETAWKALPWKDPLGKKIDNNQFTVVGVIKDFHPYSVHEKIPPFYMTLNSGDVSDGEIFTIRIKPYDRENTAALVRQRFRNFFPDAIIEVTTFDDIDMGTKGTWTIVENVFIAFAMIAVIIAANGLFGMISFAAERRMKEIGVRKVFGAGTPHLYLTMSKEFAAILLFSALAAFPAGYLLAETTPGAYKYQMQFTDYLFVIGLMIATAVIASAYHTTKAVLSNPVDVLRYE